MSSTPQTRKIQIFPHKVDFRYVFNDWIASILVTTTFRVLIKSRNTNTQLSGYELDSEERKTINKNNFKKVHMALTEMGDHGKKVHKEYY